jgi:multicomponent K+:H+ antiporter subunit D
VQSTLTSAALFLLAGLLVKDADGRSISSSTAALQNPGTLFAGLYFLLAIAMVGMPPLAGFIGKLLILDAARPGPHIVAVWSAILITGLLLTIGFARTGIDMFWRKAKSGAPRVALRAAPILPTVVVAAMIAVLAALSLLAGPIMEDMTATAKQLLQPQTYIRAVLGPRQSAAHMGE